MDHSLLSEKEVAQKLGITVDALKAIPSWELRRVENFGGGTWYYKHDFDAYVEENGLERKVIDNWKKEWAKVIVKNTTSKQTNKALPNPGGIRNGETASQYADRCKAEFKNHLKAFGHSEKVVNSFGGFRMVWNGWSQSQYKTLYNGI